MDPSKAELSLMASFQNIFVQTSVYHNYCFQCSVFINWARMQHPFLFVQDCSSETSEKVLVDKLNRFFFCERDLKWSCVFLRWHLVTTTSEGKQLCYYVPETLHNIFERFCTKKTAKSVLQWLTVSKSFCDLTKLKTTFVNKLKHISCFFNLFVYFHYLYYFQVL